MNEPLGENAVGGRPSVCVCGRKWLLEPAGWLSGLLRCSMAGSVLHILS